MGATITGTVGGITTTAGEPTFIPAANESLITFDTTNGVFYMFTDAWFIVPVGDNASEPSNPTANPSTAFDNLEPVVLTTGLNNDFVIPNFDTVSGIEDSNVGNVTLTGIDSTGIVTNITKYIVNIGTNRIRITDNDGGSLPANQFNTPNGVNIDIQPFGSAAIMYNVSLGKWLILTYA